MPAVFARIAANLLAAICSEYKVPMLTTSAWLSATKSSTSSLECTMAGEAPSASSAFALLFITTKLVMLCTRGRRSRMALSNLQIWSAVTAVEIYSLKIGLCCSITLTKVVRLLSSLSWLAPT